jgi:hypothetical protein
VCPTVSLLWFHPLLPRELSCGSLQASSCSGSLTRSCTRPASNAAVPRSSCRSGGSKALSIGDPFLAQLHVSLTPCIVTAISRRLDRRTGRVEEYNPTTLSVGEFGVVALAFAAPVWCEAAGASSALRRLSALEAGNGSSGSSGQVCFVGQLKSVEVCYRLASPSNVSFPAAWLVLAHTRRGFPSCRACCSCPWLHLAVRPGYASPQH